MGEDVAPRRALTMPEVTVSLHGVPFAWDARALPTDPLACLSALPRTDAAAAVTVHLARRAAHGPPARGTPWFFHGVLQVSRRDGATLLDDGASSAVVSRGAVHAELAVLGDELAPYASGLVSAAVLLALREEGLFDLHAAALVDARGRGIVVAGDSGAGKTTTTLALLETGGSYVGDDRVFLRDAGDDVAVLAWPREFHLGPGTLAFCPRLAPLMGNAYGSGEKRTLAPERAYPGRFLAALPRVDALVFPRIAAQERTEATPLDRASAFGELLVAGAMALLDGVTGGAAQRDLLRRLADGAVALQLTLGRDVAAAPSVIARAVDAALEGAR